MGDLLKNKVAIVTGSGRGIGRAHALAMAAQGAKVIVNDLGVDLDGSGTDKIPADEVVSEIKNMGGDAVANYCSVATSREASDIIQTAIKNFGRLDILMNNAGIFGRRAFMWDLTDEDLESMVKTHIYGHFFCAREAIKVFRRQKSGRIINTASTAGLAMNYGGEKDPRNIHYSTAKEALVGLTRALASEVSSEAGIPGVTINCIRPGATTRLARALLVKSSAPKKEQEEGEKMLAVRLQQSPPEAISALVVFLASDVASNVNGCIFYVEGGEVSIWSDPPYKQGTVWKKNGIWTPEELVDLLPKTLTVGKVREYRKG